MIGANAETEGVVQQSEELQDAAVGHEEIVCEEWDSIIEKYSKCDLTYPSDKLIALTGCARRIQEVALREPEDYLAGLGAKYFLSVFYGNCTASQPKLYRAPTWSWASLDGSVKNNPVLKSKWNLAHRILLEVLKAEVGCQQDLFGQLHTVVFSGNPVHDKNQNRFV